MGHYPWLHIAGGSVIAGGEELLAMFTEDERVHEHASATGWDSWDTDTMSLGYRSTAYTLLGRLQAQGMTSARARDDLDEELRRWHSEDPGPLPNWTAPVPTAADVLQEAARRLASPTDIHTFPPENDPLSVMMRMSERSMLRLLLDCVPAVAPVALDLSQLTGGCCFPFDEDEPRATNARAGQLALGREISPLLVLTEGVSDARLLSQAIQVTHPHLAGFVNFLDFDAPATRPEGGAGALARNAVAFIAAGVTNRFIALADNDVAAHRSMGKLKRRALPDHCRILHYPSLPLLADYPTLPFGTSVPVPADLNGTAGSLEMYLGRDVLTGPDDLLLPLPLAEDGTGRFSSYQKRVIQERFARKAGTALAREPAAEPTGDWTGTSAIIEAILHAFDRPHV
ncbi:hypothetical protein [Streptacidiphilus sp. PAMC 29251]